MHLTPTARIFVWLGLVLGSIATAISFYTTTAAQIELGRSFFGAIFHFFSFYTNWTNILLVLIYLAILRSKGSLNSAAASLTGLSSIIMVMIVYHFLLSATHFPVGIDIVTNVVKHYMSPVIFMIFWVASKHIGALNWSDLYKAILLPMAYLVFTYVKAAITGEYPYDFLNYSLNGFSGVAPIIGAIVVLILALGSLAIYYDNKTANRT